jgi:hypothetical protein
MQIDLTTKFPIPSQTSDSDKKGITNDSKSARFYILLFRNWNNLEA